jgi:hypothetical protein
MTNSRACTLIPAVLVMLVTVSCGRASVDAPAGSVGTVPTPSVAALLNLFAATTGNEPLQAEAQALVAGDRQPGRDDPGWPLVTYLLGEYHRGHGNPVAAKAAFRALATWVGSAGPEGPYGDTWGGSGLAAVGLWRWLDAPGAEDRIDPGELDELLSVAARLRDTRLYSGMVRPGLLPALSLLDEHIIDRLAHLAWTNGRKDQARALFV